MQVSQMKRAVSQSSALLSAAIQGFRSRNGAGSKESVIPPTTAMSKHC